MTTEQQPAEAPAFDAQAWLDSATSTTRAVTLQQRPDLVGVAEDLTRRLRTAENITEGGGTPDDDPEALLRDLEDVHAQWKTFTLPVRVEGRSDASRERIRKALPKAAREDDDELTLHWLADAITSPTGLDVEWLRTIRERQKSQFQLLLLAATQASTQPPGVLYAQAYRRGRTR